MDVRKDDFPVVVQAYDADNRSDNFIAEQVVHSQTEVDQFTSRFAGMLIKARKLTSVEARRDVRDDDRYEHKRSGSSAWTWVLVLLILAALVAVGFYTGWIQNTFGIYLGTVVPQSIGLSHLN